MRLIALILVGPIIWAITFSLVYALHGAGCALGWPEVDLVGEVSLHHALMWGAWAVGLAACALFLARLPADQGVDYWLPRACGWIGLVATFYTLFPVVTTSTCLVAG